MTAWVPGIVIDVSKWQDALPDLTGVIGVIARAGIGTAPDAMFASHIANARKAGKWVGSYWFGWGTLSVSDQVNAYIAREQSVGGVNLHVLDWESADGLSATQATEFIRLYRDRTGEPIALYASESRFRDLGQDWDWIANYSQEPIKHYDMWQYGPFRGVDGNHAKQRILDLVAGDTVDSFQTETFDAVIPLADGAKVYATSDLSGTPIVVSPGRTFDFVGVTDSGARIIRWEPRAGDATVYPVKTGWSGYVAAGSTGAAVPKPDLTPYSQAQLDAAAAAAAKAQAAADQAAIDKAVADLATAAADERERIALALGAEEEDRVRNTAP